MAYSMLGIAGLGFIVWGHHMFQSGMNPILGTTFMISTMVIAVPSAIKTFNWLGTLWGGNIQFTTPMLNALGVRVDVRHRRALRHLHGVDARSTSSSTTPTSSSAHIHYVLFGGSLFGAFAGLYYWFPKMFGRMMNERWGKIHLAADVHRRSTSSSSRCTSSGMRGMHAAHLRLHAVRAPQGPAADEPVHDDLRSSSSARPS